MEPQSKQATCDVEETVQATHVPCTWGLSLDGYTTGPYTGNSGSDHDTFFGQPPQVLRCGASASRSFLFGTLLDLLRLALGLVLLAQRVEGTLARTWMVPNANIYYGRQFGYYDKGFGLSLSTCFQTLSGAL